MTNKKSETSDRRAALEKLGIACVLTTIWTKPVINAVVLPAHAQTSSAGPETPPTTILPTITLGATLSVAAQIPPPVIPAGLNPSGTVNASFDPNTNRLTLSGMASELSSLSVMAHIHGPAVPGQNGPIISPLDLSGDPANQSVLFSGELSEPNIGYLLSGMIYVNIHTLDNVSGEVRGQMVVI